MRISQNAIDQIQPLDHTNFEKIKTEYLKIHHDISGLRFLRDKAGRERDLRELYRGRAPYELLQNADDAGAIKAVFILSSSGLAFAHDGSWFTVANFKSLADGWSDKDPKECIGHKGIGFRSVLDLTPSPYLIHVEGEGFFAVKFTWALNNGHIQETLKRDPSSRPEYNNWTKHGQQACPVMAIPGFAKKHTLGACTTILDSLTRGVYGDDYTTLFWFPATDPDIDRKALEDISPIPLTSDTSGKETLLDFLKYEVSVLLPFLASIQDVAVYVDEMYVASVALLRETSKTKPGEITVRTEIGKNVQEHVFFQTRSAFRIPPEVAGKPDTPKAVKAMGEAKIVLSVALQNSQPLYSDDASFHVYFPTEEKTGLGFTVHGDFYVKPDRTRLMEGNYNEWLLGEVAKVAAGRFLTQLLERYEPRAVFEALSPQTYASTPAAQNLVGLFAKQLQARELPFVPTVNGLVRQRAAVLPPSIDTDGFWESHFSDVATEVIAGQKSLLRCDVDGRQSRKFLELAGVQVLEPDMLLTLLEFAAQRGKSALWWYECYAYLASEGSKLSGKGPAFFSGRRLVPTSEATVIPVTEENSDLVVCMPPARQTAAKLVPSIFSSVFVFLDPDLAQLLENGEDTVQAWVLDRFRIVRFEATQLLPRAVTSVNPKLFSGEMVVTSAELRRAWVFIKAIIDASRVPITSHNFIERLGRLPLPLSGITSDSAPLDPHSLVPVFLAYWPESYAKGESSLAGIQTLRRVDAMFLEQLITESGKPRQEWGNLFELLGVSSSPKLLSYARYAVGEQELLFNAQAITEFREQQFSGERQNDENLAVIQLLTQEKALWEETVRSAKLCEHDFSKELQSLAALDGLKECVDAAQEAYQAESEQWEHRLWALINELGRHSPFVQGETDTVFCPGGGRGGHNIPIGSYLQRQLAYYPWLPSTLGPISSADGFVRPSSRRLVSSGGADKELGDILFPYVVVDTNSELAKLEDLGVEVLEDPASTTSKALIRALIILGERLSTEWGQQEILSVRGNWRLVRGAIQEIYRILNQRKEALDYPEDMRLAVRTKSEITEFQILPLYYAEPGSPIERAFLGILPLIDVDRAYSEFFTQVGIKRLTAGQTVEEVFLAEANATSLPHLRDQITQELAPYLLAPIIAKTDKSNQSDIVLHRLQERFEVKAAEHLTVRYSLVDQPHIDTTVEFPKFYLQRRVIPGPGAIQEAHFILYVAGKSPVSLFDPTLDADALGAALTSVFLDDLSEEFAGLFPRITSRYCHCQGQTEEMMQFLHYQLGISREAQDMANAVISGEAPEEVSSPPPAKFIRPSSDTGQPAFDDKQEVIEKQWKTAQQQVENFFQNLPQREETEQKDQVDDPNRESSAIKVSHPGPGGPTKEQQERGRRGEEELKRRMNLPGGWEGFVLLEDRREDGCGYDFLCMLDQRRVNVEIKTFTRNGYIVVTETELRAAAHNQTDYYMVGILADEYLPESKWETVVICDPMSSLLRAGTIRIQAEVRAYASDIFHFNQQEE